MKSLVLHLGRKHINTVVISLFYSHTKQLLCCDRLDLGQMRHSSRASNHSCNQGLHYQ